MNADRIAQVYFGSPLHPSTVRCRRRIHWMCAQATGQRVLDIGCSQGIVCLILAREGFTCTGVDLEDAQLAWARTESANEPPMVRSRLRFEIADATALPYEDGAFDTVLLGEVLEHLAQPDRVLQEVRRVLAPGGRVVITVPLGLHHDHADHKHVFYPTSLARLVRPFFRVTSVAALDSYVACTAINDREAAPLPARDASDDWLVQELEAYCVKVESERQRVRRHLRNMKAALDAAHGTLQEAEGGSRDAAALHLRVRELEEAVAGRDAALAEAEASSQRVAERLRETQQSLEALSAASTEARAREADLRRRLDEQRAAMTAAVEAARADARRDTLRRARHDARAAQQAEALRQLVRGGVPPRAKVLVVSKGDERLTDLDGRTGLHFPQDAGGGYAGFHPPDGAWAVAHLKELKAAGAQYLLLPATAYWWLDHYGEFRSHLARECSAVAYQADVGLLLALAPPDKDRPPLALPLERAAAPVARAVAPAVRAPAAAPPRAVPPARAPVQATAPAAPSLVSASAVSEPAAPAGRPVVTLGAVLDAFTSNCLRPEARLVTFRPDNWRETLERHRPDAVFVESAWDGNDGAWKYRVASYPTNKGDELVDLVRWAQSRRIPTVFWNKEDPVHFERFVHRGRHFDHIFTTDANCIDRYRALLGHDRVYDLPFAAQPALHNPVQQEPRAGTVCFAGSYYGDRHDTRRRDLEHILRPALDYGLDIYDRRFGVAGADAASYTFPDVYQPAIRGRLEYADMVKAYKRYRVFLNVNSVTESPTMFSRRVFELLACGTPVISSPARGLGALLGDDTVAIAASEADTRRHLDRLLGDEDAWARASLRGIRRVLEGHTYRRRLSQLWERLGLPQAGQEGPGIGIVARVTTDAGARALADAAASQTTRPAAVVVARGADVPPAAVEYWRGRLGEIPVWDVPLAGDRAWDQLCDRASGEWVAILDDRDHYGPNYLRDCALAARYTDRDLIGKQCFARANGGTSPIAVGAGCDFRATWSVAGATLVARRERVSPDLLREAMRSRVFCRPSADLLSIDRFNYLQDAGAAGPAGRRDPRLLQAAEA